MPKTLKTQPKQKRTQDCFHSDEHWGKCNQIRQVRTKTRCDNAVYHCVKHMRNHHLSDFLPKIIWEKNGSKHYKWKSVIKAWEYAKVCPRRLVKVNGTYVVFYIRKKIYLLFFYADSVLDGFLKFIKNHTNFLGHLKNDFTRYIENEEAPEELSVTCPFDDPAYVTSVAGIKIDLCRLWIILYQIYK